MKSRDASAVVLALAVAGAGCSRSVVPDPRDAAREYAQAAERGDAEAVYAMLTAESKRTYGQEGTRRLVADTQAELKKQGKALASDATSVRATATVRFDDGEQALLEIQDGRFLVSSARALPAGARSPAQALEQLRRVLARRSYAGLVRVLSTETKSAVENDLRSLVSGLEEPETLDVKVTGDTAEVDVPGGHKVRLKRESGVWKVEDFD